MLEKKVSTLLSEDYIATAGINFMLKIQNTIADIDSIVKMLNTVDKKTEKHIIETLNSEEITKSMLAFKDIVVRILDVIVGIDSTIEILNKESMLIFEDIAVKILTSIDDIDSIVDILNEVDTATREHIMEVLAVKNTELAEKIKKHIFVFEDIRTLHDRTIQRILRDVEAGDLGIALKGSSEEIQNVIFSNLSKRLATMMKEDMDYMGPVQLRYVEDAQKKIVNIIKKLEDAGEIVIPHGGGDEIIVQYNQVN